MQLLVIAVQGYQLVMSAAFYDTAFMKHADFIGMFDGAQPVGNGYRRTRLHQAEKSILHQTFTLGVKGRCCLIENQNWWILQNGTCNGDALALTTRKTASAVADVCIVAMFHSPHEIMGVGNLRRILHFFQRGVLHTEGDIVSHRIVKEDCFLIHIADEFAQIVHTEVLHVDAVDKQWQ